MSITVFILVAAAIAAFFFYRFQRKNHTETHLLIQKEFSQRSWRIIKISPKPTISTDLSADAKVYHVSYCNENGDRRDCNVVNFDGNSLRFYEEAI